MRRKILLLENDAVVHEIDVDREIAEFDEFMKTNRPKMEKAARLFNWVRVIVILIWGASVYYLCDAFYEHNVWSFYIQLACVIVNTINVYFHLTR